MEATENKSSIGDAADVGPSNLDSRQILYVCVFLDLWPLRWLIALNTDACQNVVYQTVPDGLDQLRVFILVSQQLHNQLVEPKIELRRTSRLCLG